MSRVILHIDMNSFYASVEIALNPALQGKPLVVAGNPRVRQGIVLTSSYEARQFGVYAPMPLNEAYRKCPQLVVLPPQFDQYGKYSHLIFDIIRNYSETIEKVSIDEGYVDLSHLPPQKVIPIAKQIQHEILQTYSLPSSIGIAPNKFLAKMASEMQKPNGFTVLRKKDIPLMLWPLPVAKMHYVGKKTSEALHKLGISTIRDLATAEEHPLVATLGPHAKGLQLLAKGIDDRPIVDESESTQKQMSRSTTFPVDYDQLRDILQSFEELANDVSEGLIGQFVKAKTVSIQIRYAHFETFSRSKKLNPPTNDPKVLFQKAKHLFEANWDGNPIRLIGVSATQFVSSSEANKQLSVFDYEAEIKKEPLVDTIGSLRNRFGDGAVVRASEMKRQKKP
jgi:DNA polymerase-4